MAERTGKVALWTGKVVKYTLSSYKNIFYKNIEDEIILGHFRNILKINATKKNTILCNETL